MWNVKRLALSATLGVAAMFGFAGNAQAYTLGPTWPSEATQFVVARLHGTYTQVLVEKTASGKCNKQTINIPDTTLADGAVVTGTAYADKMIVLTERKTICGYDLDPLLRDDQYRVVFEGGDGNDFLYGVFLQGGAGDDFMIGFSTGAYNQTYQLAVLYGQAGNDTVLSTNYADFVDTGDGDDWLCMWQPDTIDFNYPVRIAVGGAGQDTIWGPDPSFEYEFEVVRPISDSACSNGLWIGALVLSNLN